MNALLWCSQILLLKLWKSGSLVRGSCPLCGTNLEPWTLLNLTTFSGTQFHFTHRFDHYMPAGPLLHVQAVYNFGPLKLWIGLSEILWLFPFFIDLMLIIKTELTATVVSDYELDSKLSLQTEYSLTGPDAGWFTQGDRYGICASCCLEYK